MVLSELIRKLQTLPRDAEILLKDGWELLRCRRDSGRQGPFGNDYLVVLEGKPFIQIKGGKQPVVVTGDVVELAPTNLVQEAFDGYIKSVYPDQPKEGTEQYEQLRDAFFGGCGWSLAQDAEIDLAPELVRFLQAKKMNIEFGGGKP